MDEQKKILIDRFWNGTATEQQQQQLLRMLDEQHDHMMSAQVEEFYEANTLGKVQLTKEQADQLLMKLHENIGINGTTKNKNKKAGWIRPIYWQAAAVFIVLLGTMVYFNTRYPSPKTAPASYAMLNKQAALITIHNESRKAKLVQLPDHSEVRLYAQSTISYPDSFVHQRHITLTGFARFKVAKDRQHPFRVSANGFSTTALGTQFTVNTRVKDHLIVKLFEGRVVVRKETSRPSDPAADVYMSPGQQLSINLKNGEKDINTLLPKAYSPVQQQQPETTPEVIVFSKDPLPQAFRKIEAAYRVEISYDYQDLKGLSFSGKINKSDSLSMVLNAVCILNDLSFTQAGNKITISRK